MIDRKPVLHRLGFIVLAHDKLAAADVADARDSGRDGLPHTLRPLMRSMMVASATSMETT